MSNTPGVLTNATAEHTIGLMLALLRRIGEGDRSLRRATTGSGGRTSWSAKASRASKVLVVGPGRIGRRVAELAEAHGADVSFVGRGDDSARRLGAADVVTLHCPLTAETRHLMGADALAAMKTTAVLVNTARGRSSTSRRLSGRFAWGRIAGAALDVFEHEPVVNEELLAMENVVLTPHIASATRETRRAMGMLVVSALSRGASRGPDARERGVASRVPAFGSQSMTGHLERVLVRPPLAGDVERWREYGWRSAPDHAAAAAEHEFFRGILEAAGAEVVVSRADPGNPRRDLCLRPDSRRGAGRGVAAPGQGGTARRARPRSQRRSRRPAFRSTAELTAPVIAEGGDTVWLDEATLLVGIGYRTSPAGSRAGPRPSPEST